MPTRPAERDNSGPSISAVIPCYDAAAFLRATIESMLGQAQPVLEVLVVVDGSTYATPISAKSFGTPVRVFRQPNLGESAARNRRIEAAVGDWVAFLDTDDLWLQTKVERQAEAIRSAPADVVCVIGDFFLFGEG
jgi:glycosyltransferase involved in cell wall biosynthesis